MQLLMIIWWLSAFVIIWGMAGYPVSLIIINRLLHKENEKDEHYEPTVSIMVVAHNEEKVIEGKLENLLQINYPTEKTEIIIASDFSTDRTDEIVEHYIALHPERRIRIHKSANHFGKTNAQNEAQKECRSEILIMTDANALFEKNAVKELVSFFYDPSIAYVTGQLCYINTAGNATAESEGFYWKLDLLCRKIESKIQTITAGNGAIYAVRNSEYIDIPPIECHDSSFPVLYALRKQRALYNPNAIAYEKAGETDEDEFKRKVRMNRTILKDILPDIRIFNIFSYHWFSYFYFGHRTCRYLLWLAHIILIASNSALIFSGNAFWMITFILQLLFYLTAIYGRKTKSQNRMIKIVSYYCMTIAAQIKGVINCLLRKTKPVWEKAESTR